MGIAYDKMPKEMLEQFRSDMITLPYEEFLKWPAHEQQQVIALIAADFEAIMMPDERMDLREAYLSTIKDEERKRSLYEHWQRAIRKRRRQVH
jgi:hypothetical protein